MSGRRVAIMQPYFCPYLGYFQLIGAVDTFVVYDDIQYTKKGWINRNRILVEGKEVRITLPLEAGSDFLDVRERRLAQSFDRKKLLNRIREAYRRAPCFGAAFPVVEEIVGCPAPNLFDYLLHSLRAWCRYLELGTPLVVSSSVPADHTLRAQERVLGLCAALGAQTYVNAIGGVELYSREAFAARGVDLRFLKSRPFEYPQGGGPFVPWLSIIDVAMFNPLAAIRACLASNYDLV